jgi:TolB-like protein
LLYLFDNCTFDTGRRELRRGSDFVALEPQVFDLIEYLIRNRDRVVSKQDILDSVWNGRAVSDSALSTRINAARLAVGDSGDKQGLIKTLPRKGFRFVGEVREQSDAPASQMRANAASTPTEKPSIAVLPFDNLSGDPAHDYFADGMAEEITTALARCPSLLVISRNSSFTYRGKPTDVRQIGNDLGVRYVLEGSVRRSADRLRFAGQLIDARTGLHLWADRFDGDMSDVFALQDRFTASVVATIVPQLQLAEIERQARKPVENLNAYDLLLRALQRQYEFTDEGNDAALDYLKKALALDPSYAAAMALAAHCYTERRFVGWTKDIDAEQGEGLRLAARAVALARDDSDVLWMAAWTYWILAQDARVAREFATRSIELNANCAGALALAGWIEVTDDRSEQAFELIGLAHRLNPRDPRDWFTLTAMAAACLAARRFEEAVVWARRSLVRNPRFSSTMRILSSSLASLGQTEEAADLLHRVYEIEPNLTLGKLRSRMTYMHPRVWETFSSGLRLAGMNE